MSFSHVRVNISPPIIDPIKLIRRIGAVERAIAELTHECEKIAVKRSDIAPAIVELQQQNVLLVRQVSNVKKGMHGGLLSITSLKSFVFFITHHELFWVHPFILFFFSVIKLARYFPAELLTTTPKQHSQTSSNDQKDDEDNNNHHQQHRRKQMTDDGHDNNDNDSRDDDSITLEEDWDRMAQKLNEQAKFFVSDTSSNNNN